MIARKKCRPGVELIHTVTGAAVKFFRKSPGMLEYAAENGRAFLPDDEAETLFADPCWRVARRAGGYVFYCDETGHWGVAKEGEPAPAHCAYASAEAIAKLKGVRL